MNSYRLYLASLIWLAVAILLTGCMKVGPDYSRPPMKVSRNWLETSDERLSSAPADYRAWWNVFDDPALQRIMDAAYRENLSLKIAAVRVLEARAQLGIAIGELYPQRQQAAGSLTFNRSSESSPAAAVSQASSQLASASSGGTQLSFWQNQVNLSASWEIDFWGKFRRAVESADASLRSSLADYDNALVSLTADAAALYIQIQTLQRRIEIARQNLEIQRESLRIAESRFHAGASSERDVAQASTLLFSTQAGIPLLEAQLRQAKNALSVLIGLPPDNLTDIFEGSRQIPVPPPQVAIGIPAELLRRRPDLRSAELQAVAQSAQIGIAKAELYPAFSLTGSFGLQASTAGKAQLSDFFNFGSRSGSAGPSFQWNILNYGIITNNVRVQDARFQALLLSYQNAVLKAQQEVEDSLAGFLRAQENSEYLAQSAAAAKRSVDLAFIQYQQGSTDFTTVLTAQQALLSAQDSLATSLGSISTNLVGVYRAIGGGWQVREGKDIVGQEMREVMEKRTNWGSLPAPSVFMPQSSPETTDLRRPDW
ncbi:MAG: efflux transporter outer membrane subunit [Syntrophobacteraceae bacterium]